MREGGRTLLDERRRWPAVVSGLGVVAAVGAVAVFAVVALGPSGPSDEKLTAAVADGFLDAWAEEDWQAFDAWVAEGEAKPAAAVHEQLHTGLELSDASFEASPPEVAEGTARVDVEAEWEIAGFGTHRYDTTLRLVPVEGEAEEPVEPADRWRVDWSPTTAHPELTEGARAERVRLVPGRAPILDADGQPLATTEEEVVVSVVPDTALAEEDLLDTLGGMPQVDRDRVAAVLEQNGMTPQPVARLTRRDFEAVRGELFDVPGLRFRREGERVLHGPPALAQVVGTVGEATAEQLQELPDHYQSGDAAGRSGVEEAHETRLAGEPAEQARLVDETGVLHVLAEREFVEPQSVRTTLDPELVESAHAALAGVGQPAALVAVDVPTGEVRASVSTPLGGLNRALTGRYPPGSTLKTVTAAALLADGLATDAAVQCPPTVTILGRTFRNAHGDGPGPITFDEAFRRSCNTAFTQLAVDLGEEAVVGMAETFGFNTELRLGVPSADPSFPAPRDDAELAAAAIGQARVETTPAHMASVAAAVAAGEWRPPMIVRDDGTPEARPLPPPVSQTLTALMRGVVATGTGTAAQRPGAPVAGKTGSAEFGSGPPFETHAWFIGFRDEVAFAAFVEGGGAGGSVAAPVAAAFLAELEGSPAP